MKTSTRALKKHFLLYIVLLSFNLNAQTFKLATWNVLSESPYLHAFAKENPKPTLMPAADRVKLHKKYLKELKQNNIDIICLQEVNFHPQSSDGENLVDYLENTLGYTVFYTESKNVTPFFEKNLTVIKNWLTTTYPQAILPKDSTILQILTNKALSQSTIIAYNPKTFKINQIIDPMALYNIREIEMLPNQTTEKLTSLVPKQIKNIASISLQLKEDPHAPALLITSLHIPFNALEDPATNLDHKNFWTIKQLNYTLKHRTNKKGFSIICGDFNWETQSYTYPHQTKNGKANYDYADILTSNENLSPNLWQNAAGKNAWPTAFIGTGKLATFDYIFYTPAPQGTPSKSSYQLRCLNFSQKPDITDNYWNKLIKHSYIQDDQGNKLVTTDNNLIYADFPSDHVILIAEFEIVDTAKEKLINPANLNNLAYALHHLKA